ncbi:MAG: YncE family protein [Hyphomicrobiales bacterium]|nr:YncE family protein [Hyphomicrobiales bacterium]
MRSFKSLLAIICLAVIAASPSARADDTPAAKAPATGLAAPQATPAAPAAPAPAAPVPAVAAPKAPDSGAAAPAPAPAAVTAAPDKAPQAAAPVANPQPAAIVTVPGMPPVTNPANIYAQAGKNMISPVLAGVPTRVYVPHIRSGDLWEIDPASHAVTAIYKFGRDLQHVVPSYDLKTLWVTASRRNSRVRGELIAIDPMTGKPTRKIEVYDAYNLYFTPNGASAIVVAEDRRTLEFRDPQTMALQKSLYIRKCIGINHADFSADGRYAIFTCEFSGRLVKIDMTDDKVVGFLDMSKGGMPQDIRLGPDGKTFYVANMKLDGVTLVDGDTLQETGFIATGIATHGLYPSRDGKELYVTNRGTHCIDGPPHGPGSVSVIDFATGKVVATWHIPGGGSPDMGNVSADGKDLWISGRFDNEVYDFNTKTGHVTIMPVDHMPHGLTIYPQPGRYSLGHTGIMR